MIMKKDIQMIGNFITGEWEENILYQKWVMSFFFVQPLLFRTDSPDKLKVVSATSSTIKETNSLMRDEKILSSIHFCSVTATHRRSLICVVPDNPCGPEMGNILQKFW